MKACLQVTFDILPQVQHLISPVEMGEREGKRELARLNLSCGLTERDESEMQTFQILRFTFQCLSTLCTLQCKVIVIRQYFLVRPGMRSNHLDVTLTDTTLLPTISKVEIQLLLWRLYLEKNNITRKIQNCNFDQVTTVQAEQNNP